MKKQFIYAIIFAAVIPFVTTGCLNVDRNFIDIRNQVLSSVDGKFETDLQLGIGPALLGLGSTIVKASDDDKFAADLMNDLDNVMIGIYKRIDTSTDIGGSSILKKIDETMKENGFSFIVKSRNQSELNAVYVNSGDENLNKLFVVSLNKKELVIVKVTGNLNRVITTAVKQKGINIKI